MNVNGKPWPPPISKKRKTKGRKDDRKKTFSFVYSDIIDTSLLPNTYLNIKESICKNVTIEIYRIDSYINLNIKYI